MADYFLPIVKQTAHHTITAVQTTSGVSTVLKGLCITALTIAVIVFALFLADLVFGMAGMVQIAPFKYTNLVMDIIFLLCSGVLAVMSWFTFREQV